MNALPAAPMRFVTALPFALLLALPASAQTAGRPDGAFVERRPGEHFFEYVGNEPAVEPLLYLWMAAFERAGDAAAALDSVAATSPEAVGADGWSDAERAAFRRGLVRTAVAAAAGEAHVEFAMPMTVALTPEPDRDRVHELLERRAEWLRDRLAGTADFAATAAACPDPPGTSGQAAAAALGACLGLEGEAAPWREVRDSIDGAVRVLDRLMSDREPVAAPAGGLFGRLWDDPSAVAVYELWDDVLANADEVVDGLGQAVGADSLGSSDGPPRPDEVWIGLGYAVREASETVGPLREAARLTAGVAPEGADTVVAGLAAALDDVLTRTAAVAAKASACADPRPGDRPTSPEACASTVAPDAWARLRAETLEAAGALRTVLAGAP